MSAHLDHRPTDPELHRKLHAWVAASIITPREADAIEDFEAGEGVWVSVEPATHRVPLVTEALAYVGGALAAAAAAVLLGNNWSELTPAVRAVSVGVAATAAFAGGLLLRSSDEPAFARLSSVLWFVATGLFAWFTWLISYDVLDLRGRVPVRVMGVETTVLAGALYAVRRRGLQQVALFAGLLMVFGASMPEGTPAMVALWGVAVVWIVLGILGTLDPTRVALAFGSLGALYVPLAAGQGSDVGMWLGLGTGIAMLVASIALHETLLLGFGAVGVFGYALAVLVRLFGGTAAMPIALLAVGALVLVVAVVLARRTTRTGPRSPS
jgi:Predicted membrane protein (DUF2157)